MITTRRLMILRAGGCVVLASAVLAFTGCSSGSAAIGSAPRAIDAKKLVEAWTKAGLNVEGFGPVDGAPYASSSCVGGEVSGISAVLCSYSDDAALAAGQAAADKAIGDALAGLPAARGRSLLVLIDRSKVDPQGAHSKHMNEMAKVFASL